MILVLAFRHLWVRPLRSLFLLLGFALGVGVMIVLLSVGEAMLVQSRDVSLVGGGEVTVLPQGIDVEAMRTGGLGGMFLGIDRARYVGRQLIGGPRHEDLVAAVAPAIVGKALYLRAARGGHGGPPLRVRASAEVPSRARAVGAGLEVTAGRWLDTAGDSAWVAPTADQLYAGLDHFHLPRRTDSTWAEWHYFNLASGPGEWWYITYMIGGEVPTGRWGGRLLITHQRKSGAVGVFTADIPADQVIFDTTRADLTLGPNTVRQKDGVYYLHAVAPGEAGRVVIDLEVRPLPHRYFPPLELREDEFISGYVVPALAATATGRLCVGERCTRIEGARAYHDHNWGVWRGVTWEWGTAGGDRFDLLYGGVYGPEGTAATSATPFFLALVDSLGVTQVLRFRSIEYGGSRPATGAEGATAPEWFTLRAARQADTVRLRVAVEHAKATVAQVGGFERYFLQMRGRFALDGRVAGRAVADSGRGFFETYVRTGP